MNPEMFTQSMQLALQSAQQKAMENQHQQLTPWHVLKALLQPSSDLALTLIEKAGGNLANFTSECEQQIKNQPKVTGAAGQMYLSVELAQILATAGREQAFRRALALGEVQQVEVVVQRRQRVCPRAGALALLRLLLRSAVAPDGEPLVLRFGGVHRGDRRGRHGECAVRRCTPVGGCVVKRSGTLTPKAEAPCALAL